MSASLALSIDCDGCTVARLREVFSFWRGELGLPVASSMFLFSRNPAAPPQAAYLDGDRDALRDLVERGWIDTLHSLGDLVAPLPRAEVERAFEELRKDGVRIEVWTNHGGPENVHNLLRSNARGDLRGSDAYLADLALAYGIRFVWASELTHVVGQDRPCRPADYYRSYPGASWAAQRAAAFLPGAAAALNLEPFPGNALLRRRALRDGSEVFTFLRHGRWRFDTISVLPRLLSPAVLDELASRGGSMALYLHIGPSRDETRESFQAGLEALRDVARRPEIRMLRTADLLRGAVPA